MSRPAARHGSGEALYVGGSFSFIPGASNTRRVAKWDGQAWSAVGQGLSGPDGFVPRLAVLSDDAGAALYAYGKGISTDSNWCNIVRWDGQAWSKVGGAPEASTSMSPR